MYSNAPSLSSSPSPTPVILSSSLPLTFDLENYMKTAKSSASSLVSLNEAESSAAQEAIQTSLGEFLISSPIRKQRTILKTSSTKSDSTSHNFPDCTYFPFFIDPKLEKNIFDLPPDCDLQNYGVSLLDFLNNTFATSSDTTTVETVGESEDSKKENTGTFNKSFLTRRSCLNTTMIGEDKRNYNNLVREDATTKMTKKPNLRPVEAVTIRQEPIVAQRACSRPVDKPTPQFAKTFDIGSPMLNMHVVKSTNSTSKVQPNYSFGKVSAGQVLQKHLQQHLYNQSSNSSSQGTKIVTVAPVIHIPMKLEVKNQMHQNYDHYQLQQKTNMNLVDKLNEQSMDPISHLITINNRRGLAAYNEKEKLAKIPVVSAVSSSHLPYFHQGHIPSSSIKPSSYNHEEERFESDWSKGIMFSEGAGEAKIPRSQEMLNSHLHLVRSAQSRHPKHSALKNINVPSSKYSQNNLGIENFIGSCSNYSSQGCGLDGMDELGYKTSCFCAEHGFPSQGSPADLCHLDESNLRLDSQQLQIQHLFNGSKFAHQSKPFSKTVQTTKQQHARLQHLNQQMLQQQQYLQQQQWLQQHQIQQRMQHQNLFLQQNFDPPCTHPECQVSHGRLRTYNDFLTNFLSAHDASYSDDAGIDIKMLLQQHQNQQLKRQQQQLLQQQQFSQVPRKQNIDVIGDSVYFTTTNNNCNTNLLNDNASLVQPVLNNGLNVRNIRDNIANDFSSRYDETITSRNAEKVSKVNENLVELESYEDPPTQYIINADGGTDVCSPKPVRKKIESTTTAILTNVKSSNKHTTSSENSRVCYYPARAFKFYMEQHIEKILQYYEDRQQRRKQLEKEMHQMALKPWDRDGFRNLLAVKESNHLRLRRTKMDQRAFQKLANIGGGAFGNVFLVRKRDSNILYAMKCMKKKDVWNKKQIAHVKAERDILAEADNRWVVKLYFSFQDADNLYLVMEYIPGGDLMGLLMKKSIFEHELAQFYIAELVLAIESVHKLGFIHRDIKPDNILINRNGHIKLTDFGLCTGFHWTHDSDYYSEDKSTNQTPRMRRFEQTKDKSSEVKDREEGLRRKVAKSVVGTPNYIAPEVLLQSGYTSCCDWWSVGVILYEMRFGQPPFRADTAPDTQRKVINWRTTLRYPEMVPRVSRETIDLISRLCCDPENRLGSQEGGVREIQSHAFFSGIDFETLHSIKAPHIPRLQSSTDLSHFDAAKPLQQRLEPQLRNQFRGATNGLHERRASSCSSPSTTPPTHQNHCNHNFRKAPLPPTSKTKSRRRSDSVDSLIHLNGMASSRHRGSGGSGWSSRNGDCGADGSGGEESFGKHDFIDFTFRRFFDNESESTS